MCTLRLLARCGRGSGRGASRRTWGREGVIEGIFEHPDFDSYRFSTGVERSFNSLLKLAIAIYRPEQSIAISRNNAIDDISQRSQKRDPHEPL